MNYFYQLTFLILSFSGFSQVTYVPNDEFEQTLIDLGYDTILDNYVPTANIAGVTSLELFFIGPVTGIEDFTSLSELSIYNYSLESLDLSQNTALTTLTLDVSGSGLSIDLSNNTALTTLDFYSNTVNNLDLSANTALTKLTLGSGFYGDQVYNFDISMLTQLTDFKLYGNVTEVALGGNPVLEKLDIRTMDLPVGPLDLSNNPLLIDVILDYPVTNDDFLDQIPLLQKLHIRSNAITEFNGTATPLLNSLILEGNLLSDIDISENTILEELGIWGYGGQTAVTELNLENNTALKILQIACAQMSSIDLTSNTMLERLTLSGAFPSVNLSQNTALISLQLASIPATSIEFSANNLLQSVMFMFNPNLTEIDLSTNPLVKSVQIYSNPQLTTLDLRNGNNENFDSVITNSNPALGCIFVDNAQASYLNNTDVWNLGDGTFVNDETECALGTSIDQLAKTALYPNPVKDVLYIHNQNDNLGLISITDLSGKQIFSSESYTEGIDVSSFENGIYLLRYISDGNSGVERFIKQ